MQADYYFDDPKKGHTRETSHPRFRALAQADFYYDGADDFSPFGNDDGADMLAHLQQLYREGGKSDQALDFIANIVEEWDDEGPLDLIEADEAAIAAWFAQNPIYESVLQGVCQAFVAAAFGQLKITGEVNPQIRASALSALACQVRINHLARTTHPDWTYADENLERLLGMRQILESAGTLH